MDKILLIISETRKLEKYAQNCKSADKLELLKSEAKSLERFVESNKLTKITSQLNTKVLVEASPKILLKKKALSKLHALIEKIEKISDANKQLRQRESIMRRLASLEMSTDENLLAAKKIAQVNLYKILQLIFFF